MAVGTYDSHINLIPQLPAYFLPIDLLITSGRYIVGLAQWNSQQQESRDEIILPITAGLGSSR
jgi:hypothetical protein